MLESLAWTTVSVNVVIKVFSFYLSILWGVLRREACPHHCKTLNKKLKKKLKSWVGGGGKTP